MMAFRALFRGFGPSFLQEPGNSLQMGVRSVSMPSLSPSTRAPLATAFPLDPSDVPLELVLPWPGHVAS